MLRAFALTLGLLLIVNASDAAETRRSGWQPGQVLPQERPLPLTLSTLDAAQEEIYSAGILVNVGLKNENPTWAMTQTSLPVMIRKLLELQSAQPTANDVLSMKARYNEPAYKGLELRLSNIAGKKFEMVRVFNGRIVTENGVLVARDPGRLFEYWLWGTARVKREVVMGARIMPVLTFDQCRLMAQDVIDSLPRQCLLPDGDMLMDVKEPLTAASLRAKDFDGCLRHGVGIINTFPRRCVVPGGRVFVEPPRILETPADAPLAEGVSTGMPTEMSPTTAGNLPTSTTVVVPGIGNFTVSTSTVSVLSESAVVVSNSSLGRLGGGETALVPVTATVVLKNVSVAVVVTGTAVVPALTQSNSVAVPLTVTPTEAGPVVPAKVTTGADLNFGM